MQATISRTDVAAWELLKQLVQKFIPVTEKELHQWEPFFEIRGFGKKEIVTDAGELEDYINIVVTGLARKFVRLENGEVTMQIAPEGHMIHAESSFHTRKPSNVIVETIEPTIFLALSYQKMNELFDKYPKSERMARLFTNEMFIIKDRRYIDMVRKSTREIFLDYMDSHPHMLQRVPQKYLASYLNIKPETFSRLKHLLKKKR